MRTIYLFRHGKAVERVPDVDDLKRSLIKRGERETRAMAERLKSLGVEVDRVLSSPARRALETANIFARTYRYPLGKIQLDGGFYHQPNGGAFTGIFRRLPDDVERVILFGHEPTLSEFAHHLLPRFEEPLPKSGVIGILCPVERWRDLGPAVGLVKLIEYPSGGKPTRSLFCRLADAELVEQIEAFYQLKDPKTAAEMSAPIRVCVERLNRRFASIQKPRRRTAGR